MPDVLEQLAAPVEVKRGLASLRDELAAAAGANLAGLILYGGLARGRYYPGRSDVNLVVLLRNTSVSTLRAIAPPLQSAWRALRVEPMLLAPEEVQRVAAAFGPKFLDIKKHHVVLYGENPFAQLDVPIEHVRLRIVQELRNIELRLRRRFLAVANHAAEQTDVLAGIARPLAVELSALLSLAGKEVPAEDRTDAVLDAAAAAFELDRQALCQLAAVRQNQLQAGDASALYDRVLQAIAGAITAAERMKDPGR
jgi:hypothetical protein